MRNLFLILGFTILSAACSNPFSSQRPSILNDNPQTKNTNCADVRFDQSELNAKQLRAVIHCLNQGQELKEIEQWSLTISDEELSPWLNQFNSVLKNEPQFLYAVKEIYSDEKNSGEFQNFISKLFSKIDNYERKQNLLDLIKNHSPWLRNFISSPSYKINTNNVILLPEIKSFNRTINEEYKTGNYKSIIQSIVQYHKQSDALSFLVLFGLFSNARSELISNKDSAVKIAGFVNWLLAENRIDILSQAAESLKNNPITCFDQGKKINNSLDSILTELVQINPSEVTPFFQKKIPSFLLLGQGYCKIPSIVLTAAKLLQQSTEQETLTPFFALIQPLLQDKNFINLLASNSFRELSKNISTQNNTHLFQDLVTFIAWFTKNPISEKNTAKLLDSALSEFSASEILFAIDLIPDDLLFWKALNKTVQSLPKLQNTKETSPNQDWLAPITKNSFIPVLELLSRMNHDGKIIPIADRVLEIFKTMLNQGRTSYQKISLQDPQHASTSDSQNWELGFWKNTAATPTNSINCNSISLQFNFFNFPSDTSTAQYLVNLDQLSYCYGTNRSFLSLKDLTTYLVTKNSNPLFFNQLTSLQERFLNYLFLFNSDLAFHDIEQLTQLNQNDLSQLHPAIQSASALLSTSKGVLHDAGESRKLLAKYFSDKKTFAAILSQADAPDRIHESTVANTKSKLIQQILSRLPGLFTQYCPSLDTSSLTCRIDRDQVILYKQSPNQLAEKIVFEYFSSSQSWIHPLEFNQWNTAVENTKNVSYLNFHLNPLLKQFDHNPDSVKGVFDFVKRNQTSNFKMAAFIKKKASVFYVIPYVFQVARYPDSFKEFHSSIRIRIVSDLDRLELLAINADFKPFGFLRNFGMDFIKEIGVAWGDVPESERPKMGTTATVAMARASILDQFIKFNHNIFQRIESSDLRARMFNLKLMLPILDDHQELLLLRDLFYSIYEHNSADQLGVYTDGVNDLSQDVSKVDLLEIIPKIARLGLLHQAGLSIVNETEVGTNSIISVLNQSIDENNSALISEFISSSAGQTFIRDVLSLVMRFNNIENKNISTLLQNISLIKNQTWLLFVLEIMKQKPNLLSTFNPSVHEILKQTNITTLTPKMTELLSGVSSDLKNPPLINEATNLLSAISKSPENLAPLIEINLSKNFTRDWLKLLSNDENQRQRTQIASLIIGHEFDDFCDVFSDRDFSEKAYNFLENSNQNSGVSDLIEECRRFLH